MKKLLLVPLFTVFFAACETVKADIDYGDERAKSLDDDGDGLSNYDEALAGTDPDDADSDDDGIEDKSELDQGFDPLDPDDKPYIGAYPIARCDQFPEATGDAVGDITADFNLTDQHGEEVFLSDFCDSVVILEASAYG